MEIHEQSNARVLELLHGRKSKKRNDSVAFNPTPDDLSNVTSKYSVECNLEIHVLECSGETRNEDVAETDRNLAKSIEVPDDKSIIHRAHHLQQRRDGKP
ncbi:hypothetical protein J6590_101195 [Homalodisca vitripennis]|nr:hypothetical protein J6590_101195 [Homalodisca vitripennis]